MSSLPPPVDGNAVAEAAVIPEELRLNRPLMLELRLRIADEKRVTGPPSELPTLVAACRKVRQPHLPWKVAMCHNGMVTSLRRKVNFLTASPVLSELVAQFRFATKMVLVCADGSRHAVPPDDMSVRAISRASWVYEQIPGAWGAPSVSRGRDTGDSVVPLTTADGEPARDEAECTSAEPSPAAPSPSLLSMMTGPELLLQGSEPAPAPLPEQMMQGITSSHQGESDEHGDEGECASGEPSPAAPSPSLLSMMTGPEPLLQGSEPAPAPLPEQLMQGITSSHQGESDEHGDEGECASGEPSPAAPSPSLLSRMTGPEPLLQGSEPAPAPLPEQLAQGATSSHQGEPDEHGGKEECASGEPSPAGASDSKANKLSTTPPSATPHLEPPPRSCKCLDPQRTADRTVCGCVRCPTTLRAGAARRSAWRDCAEGGRPVRCLE